jgi:hypothetical protein
MWQVSVSGGRQGVKAVIPDGEGMPRELPNVLGYVPLDEELATDEKSRIAPDRPATFRAFWPNRNR